ncbi:UDP-N-acetylmuramate dehydrogenase [Mycoplasmatota bacterium WC44]
MEKYFLGRIRTDVTFKDITTLKVGGKIKYFYEPNSFESLRKFLQLADVEIFVIGNGSNVLASDDDFEGVVISLKKIPVSINNIEELFYVTSNTNVINFVNYAVKNGYTGSEFLATIPAQVGGSVYMNAGAYKGEISDIFHMCECLTYKGEIVYITKEQMKFSYRKSLLQERELIVTNVVFTLKKGRVLSMKKKIKKRKKRNKEEKPLNYPNAGSVFKNGENYSAWELIDSVGLRGYDVNNIQVSKKHANFIINCGNSEAKNVKILLETIKNKVKEKHCIELKEEWVFVNWSD